MHLRETDYNCVKFERGNCSVNYNAYELNEGTLAVIPNGNESSLVYEDDNRYIINDVPMNIMEDSCRYFGSTYEGRRVGAKEILGAEYKVPIIVADSNELIVFPTSSPLSEDCAWISFGRVDRFFKIDDSNTKILFDNGREIIVPCSYRSIENQVSRAARLKFILSKRKNS